MFCFPVTIAGGTGIDTSGATNTLTVAIDSTVATLTGTQTLTNKTLTSPDVNTPDIDGGTIDGTVIGGATTAAGSFTTLQADTSLNVDGTATADGLTVDGVASIDAGGNSTHTIGRLIIDYAGSGNPKLTSEGGDEISIDADLNIVGGEVLKATSQPSNFNFKQARTGYDIAFYTAPTANNTFVKALDIASN